MKVYYDTQVFTTKRCVLTTYSNLETRNRIYCNSIAGVNIETVIENHVCLIVGLILWLSRAILVHIV